MITYNTMRTHNTREERAWNRHECPPNVEYGVRGRISFSAKLKKSLN